MCDAVVPWLNVVIKWQRKNYQWSHRQVEDLFKLSNIYLLELWGPIHQYVATVEEVNPIKAVAYLHHQTITTEGATVSTGVGPDKYCIDNLMVCRVNSSSSCKTYISCWSFDTRLTSLS
ncbi:hypothetical protein OIU76_019939 [Salix suchowensis]|nr:hypothetical protein OIU76_019939 [Salix suchowensis]